MAKKKAKASSTKKRAKAVRKSTTKKTVKKKKVARKTAAKKIAQKAVRKVPTKKAVKKVAAKPAVKPKRPRRTKQALPPASRRAPPPIVEVAPPPPLPPPAPPALEPSPGTAPQAFGFGEVVDVSEEQGQPEDEESAAGPASAPASRPEVGEAAPEFELADEAGRVHRLAQYRGQRVVLYFYPKDDTPGCTAEACGFRDRLGAFADRNAVVLGISADSVDSHQRFAQKYGLPFALLADTDHAVAERYGACVQQKRYGTVSWGSARTTFVIDAGGCIEHVFRNVRPEGHEQEVLERLGN